jgi:hypothetical protein
MEHIHPEQRLARQRLKAPSSAVAISPWGPPPIPQVPGAFTTRLVVDAKVKVLSLSQRKKASDWISVTPIGTSKAVRPVRAKAKYLIFVSSESGGKVTEVRSLQPVKGPTRPMLKLDVPSPWSNPISLTPLGMRKVLRPVSAKAPCRMVVSLEPGAKFTEVSKR